MSVLPDEDRVALCGIFMTRASAVHEPLGNITPTELQDAINAVDDVFGQIVTLVNSAMPERVRQQLSARAKLQMFKWIADRQLEVHYG